MPAETAEMLKRPFERRSTIQRRVGSPKAENTESRVAELNI
jgi:hypothetical protein